MTSCESHTPTMMMMMKTHQHCSEAQALVVDVVAKPRRLAVRLRHPKVTYAGSKIRINLGLDVSSEDALGCIYSTPSITSESTMQSPSHVTVESGSVRGKASQGRTNCSSDFRCSSLRQVVLIRCCLLKLRLTDNLQCLSLAAVRQKRGSET